MRVRGHAADSLLRIGLPVLFLLLPFTGGAYELNDVSLNQSVGEARLLLEANGELRYDLFQLENPARVVLDLIGAETPVEPAIA